MRLQLPSPCAEVSQGAITGPLAVSFGVLSDATESHVTGQKHKPTGVTYTSERNSSCG